jgi:hypothetical protein
MSFILNKGNFNSVITVNNLELQYLVVYYLLLLTFKSNFKHVLTRYPIHCVASNNFGLVWFGICAVHISKPEINPTTIIVRTINHVAVCIFVLCDNCTQIFKFLDDNSSYTGHLLYYKRK